jgi:hypothetical protein
LFNRSASDSGGDTSAIVGDRMLPTVGHVWISGAALARRAP